MDHGCGGHCLHYVGGHVGHGGKQDRAKYRGNAEKGTWKVCFPLLGRSGHGDGGFDRNCDERMESYGASDHTVVRAAHHSL